MTRFVPVTVLVLLVASRVASADDTMPTGPLASGASISFSELQIHENNNPKLDFPETDPESKWRYFNLAHCQCTEPGASPAPEFKERTFAYLLKLENAMGMAVPQHLELWTGTNCNTDAARPPSSTATCHLIKDLGPVNNLVDPGNQRPEVPVFDLMMPAPNVTACTLTQQTGTLWALVDTNMNGIPDYAASQQLNTDALPPPLPTDFSAVGADQSIVISWKPPSDASDVYAYQALCARADDDMPGKTGNLPAQYYMTGHILCGSDKSIDLGMGTSIPAPANAPPPAAVTTLPTDLQELNPMFLCAGKITSTETSLTIGDLENGVAYKIVFLAIDKFQNATGTFFTSTVTPLPATDFWEDLHDRGSKVEGGLCTVTRTGDRGALITMLGLVAVMGYVVRRRRVTRGAAIRRSTRASVILSAMLTVTAGASQAHAGGGGYQPYWEENEPDKQEQAPTDPADLVSWHAGLRVGPYIPEIDVQFGMSPGPYEQMFGGSRFLPMLDVDRILWTGFGQLGIGISAGYMQKTAHSFTNGSDPNDPMRPRSAGDKNTFRLLPLEVAASYRFTMLDDAYGIPIVPYIRGGLAYYIWWLSASGDKVCLDGMDPAAEPGCARNVPHGASLGYQASVGIAIRAERIDAATAMSMQQSGIQHAGIYAELSLAKVDGFGSETKLSVGDRTWFAGFDFEF